jgi:uncharacterized cupin superfamily protein
MVDSTNRLDGARATFGSKKPVAAASTGDIPTLSGFQTMDGVSFSSTSDNLRVLVKDQTAAEQNGIYEQASSAWTRAKDFDGNTDLIKGTPVWVAEGGTINGGKAYEVVSDDPPNVGVDDLEFRQWLLDKFTANNTVASASTVNLNNVDGDFITVTGTTQIVTITLAAGKMRVLHFESSLVLSASIDYLPGGGNTDTGSITTRAGDIMVIRALSGGIIRVIGYFRKDGHPLIVQERTIASASTVELDQNSTIETFEQCYKITGTTTINSFGSGANTPVGAIKCIRFESAGLSIAGITGAGTGLPDGIAITTLANDILLLRRDSDQTWRAIGYFRADMHPNVSGDTTLASAATTDLGSLRQDSISITGTTTITSFGTSAPTGAKKFLRFAASLLLTHNGTSLIIPGGQSIQVFAGDRAIAQHEGSGNWRVLNVTRAAPRAAVYPSDGATASSTGGEDDLLSHNLPAGRLASSGHAVRIQAWGVAAATTIAKRVRLYFGSQVVLDSSNLVMNDVAWRAEALVTRVSTVAQRASGLFTQGSTLPITAAINTTQAMGSTLEIKVTGQATGSTSAAELTARGLLVEALGV